MSRLRIMRLGIIVPALLLVASSALAGPHFWCCKPKCAPYCSPSFGYYPTEWRPWPFGAPVPMPSELPQPPKVEEPEREPIPPPKADMSRRYPATLPEATPSRSSPYSMSGALFNGVPEAPPESPAPRRWRGIPLRP
jgi:hypothetical protein